MNNAFDPVIKDSAAFHVTFTWRQLTSMSTWTLQSLWWWWRSSCITRGPINVLTIAFVIEIRGVVMNYTKSYYHTYKKQIWALWCSNDTWPQEIWRHVRWVFSFMPADHTDDSGLLVSHPHGCVKVNMG